MSSRRRRSRAAPQAASIVWTRHPPAVRRGTVTRAQIVGAAVRLADSGGLGAVSIRRVAAELDIRPMSIYPFAGIKRKEELHDLMIDLVCGELLLRSLPRDWREALERIAGRLRTVLLRHPWWIDLVGRNLIVGPNGTRYREQTLAALAALELERSLRLAIIVAVETYVIGQVTFAIDERGGPYREGRPPAEWRRAVEGHQRELIESGEFPNIRRLGRLQPSSVSERRRFFGLGLGWLLDGIAASLESTDARADA